MEKNTLYTTWGEAIEQEKENREPSVLQEYPRPGLVRDSYINLNGWWEYAITKQSEGNRIPEHFDGRILVPFSPEAPLSGVNRQLQPEEYLWYKRLITVEKEKLKRGWHLLLQFGAVDQEAVAYGNGEILAHHMGGYLPFTADVTDCAVRSGGESLTIVIRVTDVSDTSYHARGKQKLKRGGMYYTAQSGIWQTVWMEYVPPVFVASSEVLAHPDTGEVRFLVKTEQFLADSLQKRTESLGARKLPLEITIYEPTDHPENFATPRERRDRMQEKKKLATIRDECSPGDTAAIELTLSKEQIRLWDSDTPFLYDYEIRLGELDRVYGYFALRTVSVELDPAGIPRICLNHEPVFWNGVLDQGYWPDGLLTPPCDEAYLFDIRGMRESGFFMIRKHCKIEADRFYFHCDRLGMVVWQDMVNGGTSYRDWYVTYLATVCSFLQIRCGDHHPGLLSRKEKEGCKEWADEMLATIALLKHHPSICTWVLFNEGWGQFETRKTEQLARQADNTRLIDAASGWYDQGGGDFNSFHNYFFPLTIPRQKRSCTGRAAVLSEYGGYSLGMPGHTMTEHAYGYGTCRDADELKRKYEKRRAKRDALIEKGLCASVYTQVSDIEDEINGIYTYDRKVKKWNDSEPGKFT